MNGAVQGTLLISGYRFFYGTTIIDVWCSSLRTETKQIIRNQASQTENLQTAAVSVQTK